MSNVNAPPHDPVNTVSYYRPSLAFRALRALGYRGPGWCATPDIDGWEGYTAVETVVRFTFVDRVRVLFGGNVHLSQRVLSPEAMSDAKTFTAIGIWPGNRVG